MSSKSRLPMAKHLQSVVEWRFARAHRYWDDCGKLIAAIEASFPGLACEGLQQGLQPEGFRFGGLAKGITAANFYWDKASITQAGQGDAALPDSAHAFWQQVRAGLDIPNPLRVGHRTWMCFETPSVKDAVRRLENSAIWSFAIPGAEEQLGAPRSSGIVLRTQLEPGGRRVRYEVDAGTMVVGSKQYHGVIVDVDIVVEGSASLPEDFSDFVRSNIAFLRDNVGQVFRSQ